MGCFDYACAISGLPISASDDVLWLIITESPYEKETIVSMHDFAFPRTWPVRAKYNFYGSIEDYDASSPAVIGIVEGFTKDLAEVGTGDNTVHDVATAKGMNFENILNAVQEGRIFVQREDWKSSNEHEPPAELPTLQRVRELLQANGHTIEYEGFKGGGYLVDELSRGWVRVRPASYQNRSEALQQILPLLQKSYAAMITASSGGSFEPEIQVMPLPNDKHVRIERESPETPLRNYQVMILRSVWDAIAARSEFVDRRKTLRAQAQKDWDDLAKQAILENDPDHRRKWQELCKEHPELADLHIRMSGLRGRSLGYSGSPLGLSYVPFTMGPGEHSQLIIEQHGKKPFSEQQIEEFLDDAVDLNLISHYMMKIHCWWKPSWYAGQGNRYADYREWHQMLAEICQGGSDEQE